MNGTPWEDGLVRLTCISEKASLQGSSQDMLAIWWGLYVLVLLFSVVDLGSLQTFCQKTKWQMDAIKRAASRGKSWIPRKGETSCGGPNYFCCKITQFWPFSGFHSQTENEHFTVLFNYISYGKWTKPKHLTVNSKANYVPVIVKAFNALIYI